MLHSGGDSERSRGIVEMNLRSFGFWAGICLVTVAVPVQAQQQFRLLVSQGGNISAVQSGSTLAFNSPVGVLTTAQVTATYTGSGQITIERAPNILGSTAFSAALTQATLPLTLTPGASISFEIRYRAVGPAPSGGQFVLDFRETVTPTSPSSPTSLPGTLSLLLQGTAPVFSLSYILQTDQNVVPIGSSGTLQFGPTQTNTTGQASFNITNVGSGTGAVSGISISGPAFKLSRLPLLPAAVTAGQTLQVLVLYSPLSTGVDEGQIVVSFESGSPVSINLRGSGVSANLVYEILSGGDSRTVVPGGAIELPSVAVGQNSNVILQISNKGSAPGLISSIGLAGTAFQVIGSLPLPQTLASNASLTFTIVFAPPRTGPASGTLIVNSDRFTLSGVGLGPQLTFSYSAGGATITLDANNTAVVFSPVMISQTADLVLNVKNTGTLPAPISNIGIGQTGSPFRILNLPALPLSLAPDAEFPLTIRFAPSALGFANGTLRLDGIALNITGSGTQPPPLSDYSITGPSGTVNPGAYNISLTLAAPYPVAIAGSLTVNASGTLPVDPAVQFSTGGQTVRFVIPANSTGAVFAGSASQVGLQTGTVASSIVVTPSFATQDGAVDLTPANASALRLAVAAARPTLLAVQLANQTANSFSLVVSGFTTTRTLTNLTVDFTPAAGVKMQATQFTIDVQQVATVWFRSLASQPFGGQFTLTIPFTFQNSAQATSSGVASASVKVTNEAGESAPLVTRSLTP